MKMVFIDPYYNHSAGLLGDKWFAPRLGTDVALGLAIAFTWLTEDTYDREYVSTHTVGFEEWSDYVLGKSDGVAKTPEWAESESGVPARETRALAREWAAKKTTLAAGGQGGWGGACRSATGNEWTRTMIALAAMQGLGKPGCNIWSTTHGVPCDTSLWFPGYSEGGISNDPSTASAFRSLSRLWPNGAPPGNPQHSTEGQTVSRLRIPEAMMHEHHEWRGKGFCGSSIESQFQKYEYPAPGYSPVSIYYKYGNSFIGTMTETNRYVKAYREGKVPFVVNQSIWFEGETEFADIILPACTNFERWDIGEWASASGAGAHGVHQSNHRLIVLEKKCIEPLGESKSDYQNLLTPGRAPRSRDDVHRRLRRPRLGQTHVPSERPAHPYLLGRVRQEGLLHGAGTAGPKADSGLAMVRRGPATGHTRYRSEGLGHRRSQRASDHLGQDRVRGEQSHPFLRRRSGRSGASGAGAPIVPSWEGHRTTELVGKSDTVVPSTGCNQIALADKLRGAVALPTGDVLGPQRRTLRIDHSAAVEAGEAARDELDLARGGLEPLAIDGVPDLRADIGGVPLPVLGDHLRAGVGFRSGGAGTM